MRNWIILLSVLLASCGGGSGGPSPSPPASTPAPTRSAPPQYGYFGTGPGQIHRTAAHISFVHAVDWGDWNHPELIAARIIDQMQEAKREGVKGVVLSTGFLTFTADMRYKGTADLIDFHEQLVVLGLDSLVIGLYPIDEPDMHGISDYVMFRAVAETRAAWPGPKLMVIYGDNGTPGIDAYDWIGKDDYRAGERVLQELPRIRSDQRWIIVPGGTDPFRQGPGPFTQFANQNAQVAVVMPFLWTDFTYEGVLRKGIGTNGLAREYCEAAVAMTGWGTCDGL